MDVKGVPISTASSFEMQGAKSDSDTLLSQRFVNSDATVIMNHVVDSHEQKKYSLK